MLSDATDVTWDTEETKQQRSRRRAKHGAQKERSAPKFQLGPLEADLLSAKVLKISIVCFYL